MEIKLYAESFEGVVTKAEFARQRLPVLRIRKIPLAVSLC
jgi:hypothetical protein